MFYKEFGSHFCNYQWKLFLVVLSCTHSGAAVTAWATHLLPLHHAPLCGEFLFVATSQCVCGVVKNFWRILFLVSLSVLGQQFCFLRRPWPVSYRHGKFLWFISQFTGICYSNSLSRLLSLFLSASLSWLFSALVIELDVAEFHLALVWVPSGLSMINQRTNKFLSLRFCLCFHFCLLFLSNNNQQHGSASRVFCLTEL